jgi:hypothetical protein
MDDPLQDLEAELRQLCPRTLSAGLLARVEEELTGPEAAREADPVRRWQFPPAGAPRWLLWPVATSLVAVCGIAVAYWWPAVASRSPAPSAQVSAPTEPASASFKPVAATQFLYESLDEGPVMLSSGLPARRVCNRYVDTYTWRNPRTRASVQWIIPRAEVRVVPVDAL